LEETFPETHLEKTFPESKNTFGGDISRNALGEDISRIQNPETHLEETFPESHLEKTFPEYRIQNLESRIQNPEYCLSVKPSGGPLKLVVGHPQFLNLGGNGRDLTGSGQCRRGSFPDGPWITQTPILMVGAKHRQFLNLGG